MGKATGGFSPLMRSNAEAELPSFPKEKNKNRRSFTEVASYVHWFESSLRNFGPVVSVARPQQLAKIWARKIQAAVGNNRILINACNGNTTQPLQRLHKLCRSDIEFQCLRALRLKKKIVYVENNMLSMKRELMNRQQITVI